MKWRPPNIQPRGIRTAIPTGYVIGRIDRGTGAVQLIPIARLATGLAATGIVGGGGSGGGGGGVGILQAEDGNPIFTETSDYIQVG